MLGLAALVAGAVAGAVWGLGIAACGLAVMVALHVQNLRALKRWVQSPVETPIPSGRGVWETVFAALHRFSRELSRERRSLAEALQRFRNAGEAMPDAVVMLDAGHHIEWCNAAGQTYFGLDGERDKGALVFNLIRQPEFAAYLAADRSGQALLLKSDRGGGLLISVQLIPYGDQEKLLIGQDVTEFERVATVRRDFVANVSHEIKTPLTVISGFIETIQTTGPAPQQLERYLSLMAEQAHNMQRLVEDLLVLSALENESNSVAGEPVAIAPLMNALLRDAQSLSGGRHDIQLEVQAPGAILGSEIELRSAFGNLISNAIRYTAQGGKVGIRWQMIDGAGLFSVEDSGIGIPAEHIPRLTERFYRVDRSRSRATGGTGLGLAIVRHVLLRHDATLNIDSEPGRGSRFTLKFPATRMVAVVPPPEHQLQLAASR
jgi:two-component system, OmpR family, phosphate regulon sensor histidine kinase PhoR